MSEPKFQIQALCEEGHLSSLVIDGSLGEDWVRMVAGLLDGSSSFYPEPPGEQSPIGKCHCGTPFMCRVAGAA